MTSRRKILIALAVLLGAANVALFISSQAPSAKPAAITSLTDQQLKVFQAEADKACLCTRRAGAAAHDRCWANYERLVAPLRPERLGTMCIGANYWDFFPGDKSVTLQRAGDACTEKEEKAQLAEWRRQRLIEPAGDSAGSDVGCG